MNIFKRISFLTVALLSVILLSSWGYRGHLIINGNAPLCFPPSLSFLIGDFSRILVDSASAADNRKDWDNTEAPKHFIDIDNYPEFMLRGKIPMTYDSILRAYGYAYVTDNGTVPWSTFNTYDSLRNCFAREDLVKAALFAADLGHYVGDGHMPLHLTANYDGQNTGQDGVHSRYETRMINSYYPQIIYPVDTARYIPDVPGFIFTYIYANYADVDSVLSADLVAKAQAGNTNSSTYTTALWNNTRNFTIPLFRHATYSLASLIYTAYLDGQKMAVHEQSAGTQGLGQNYPNPVRDYTVIPFDVDQNNSYVSLRILDALGNVRADLVAEKMNQGHHEIRWDSRALGDGCYYCVFKDDAIISTKKLMLMH